MGLGVSKHCRFGSVPCGDGIFKGGKRPKINCFFVEHDSGDPFTTLATPCDANYARRAPFVWSPVLPVLRSGRCAKVADSVVSAIPIYVVNLVFWAFAVRQQPRKSMGKVQPSFYLNADVPIRPHPSSKRADFYSSGGLFDPNKFSGISVVLKMFLQEAKINIVHAVAPLKQWFEKWRLSVGSTEPLRHYRST